MNAGFSPEERCLVGVSGGRDSVALLHQLHAAGFRELIVCHLDHALRHESGTEARFVEKLAAQFGYEFVLQREDISALAKHRRKSLETTAREAAAATAEALKAEEAIKPLREEATIAAAVLHQLAIEKDRIEREVEAAAAEVARITAELERIDTDRAREDHIVEDAAAALERLGTALLLGTRSA